MIFFEADIQYNEKLHEFHNDLPFLTERMKIEKVDNLLANLHNKAECVIHIRNLKQVLSHGLVLEVLTSIKSWKSSWNY